MYDAVIVESERLGCMNLSDLIGRKVKVVEDLTGDGRKEQGYIVLLEEPYLNELLWFVPWEAVDYEGVP